MSTTVLDRPAAPVVEPPLPAPVIEPPLPIQMPRRRPRLSEAIRVGAQRHPQGYGNLHDTSTGTTCALGAALVGLVGTDWMEPHAMAVFQKLSVRDIVLEKTGVDLRMFVKGPPALGSYTLDLGSLIVRLNDGLRWSRERIADYLQTRGL